MILKLKRQLSDAWLTPAAVVLSLILLVFFLYALFVDPILFVFLSLFLVVILAVLVLNELKILRRRSEANLQLLDLFEKINLLEADIEKERKAAVALEKKIVNYSRLKGLTEKLCLCFTLEDTSKTLSAEVNRIFGEEVTVILYLFHSRTGQLGISASQKGQMTVNLKDKRGDIFDQWVVQNMKPLLVEDCRKDFRFDLDKINGLTERKFRSIMASPLMVGEKAIGILRVDSPHAGAFTTEDVRLLSTVADLGAVSIENAQLYEQVEDLAIRDSLTGLFLKRYMMDRLSQEIGRTLRLNKSLSFLIMDLDHFKAYNDNFGHTAGDIVLKTLASLLREHFTAPGHILCRYGGEEFCVVLPDCPKSEAVEKAERFRRAVENHAILLRRQETRITVSVGVAAVPDDAKIRDDLIQEADMALYRAKQKGRNRVCSAEPGS